MLSENQRRAEALQVFYSSTNADEFYCELQEWQQR
jgi:hypothetical protein